jgi:AcrR family transcriptional regulator
MAVTSEKLVEGAISVLWSSDTVDDLTVDRLAAHLHMSKSTLYKHFEGLEDLVYNVVEHIADQTENDIASVGNGDGFLAVAEVYGRYSERLPTAFRGPRTKMPKSALLRLESLENRLGERVFREVIDMGYPSTTAYAIRSAFAGANKFLRVNVDVATEPNAAFSRRDAIMTLADTLLTGLAD